MSESREASLPEYINMLGNSDHRAAEEYCTMVKRIAELEEYNLQLQSLLGLATMGEEPEQAQGFDEWRMAIDDALVCCHLGTSESFKTAKHALAAIESWHYDLGKSGVCEPEQAQVDKLEGKSDE